MKTKFLPFLSILFVGLVPITTHAQFTTPTIDGTISTNEYGSHTAGQNASSAVDGRTWYVTWDNTNLYVGVLGHTNISEAMVLYIDVDPQVPVNSGTDANGTSTGTGSDNITPTLPFKADFFAYAKSGYYEFKLDNGSGGWGASTTGSLTNGFSDPNDVGEFSIAWASITGAGRPSAFNFVAFMSYDYPGVATGTYARVPSSNPGGITPEFFRYFTISSTDSGSSSKPFSQESYCHLSGSPNFGDISVYDFTMNVSGATITR
ncbi:MAG: hypothetical protein ACO3GN_08785, partial [Bacteroidia bacterium]